MFFLDYKPSDFEKDLRYLLGIHSADLKAFLNKKFAKNSGEIELKKVNLAKLWINNQSNIYSNEVTYNVDETKDNFLYLKRKKREQAKLEKYLNLNKKALFWIYVEKGKLQFKALHSSEFYINRDDYGNIQSVIVKAGSYKDESGQLQNIFYAYSGGKIYKKIAIDWDYLGEIEIDQYNQKKQTDKINLETWDKYSINPDLNTYSRLPFVSIAYDTIIEPQKSDLIDLENMYSAGNSYGEMTILISFLKKVILSSNMKDDKLKDFAAGLGISFEVGNVPEGTIVNFLDTGTVDNQLNYQQFMNVILYFLANSDGVDRYAIFPDIKVESGISRELQMGNIEQIRNQNIPIWEDFEEQTWDIISDLGFDTPTAVTYQKNVAIVASQKTENETKEFDLLERKYNAGIISKTEFIMRSEKISKEDAEKRIKEIQDERQDIDSITEVENIPADDVEDNQENNDNQNDNQV